MKQHLQLASKYVQQSGCLSNKATYISLSGQLLLSWWFNCRQSYN